MIHILNTFVPLAEKVYDRKATIDILHHLCVREGRIQMTDLQSYVSMPIDDQRSYCLPLRVLKKVLAAKPETVDIELNDNQLKIHFDKQTLTIPRIDPESYPEFPDESFEKLGIWHKDVFTKLQQQIHFTSTDTLRPALTGIYVKQNHALSSVATDGHVLKWHKDLDSDKHCVLFGDGEIILPVKAVKMLAKYVHRPVTVYRSDKYLKLNLSGDKTFYVKIIDECYVNYASVIPDDLPNKLEVNRDQLLKQIKSAKPFSGISDKVMVSCTNGSLNLKTEDFDNESQFESTVEVAGHTGDDLDVHLNINYFEKILQGMHDECVSWHYSDGDAPSVFTENDDSINLLMPVRREEVNDG